MMENNIANKIHITSG